MPRRAVPTAPGHDELAESIAKGRAQTAGQTLELDLQVVTPILGGAPTTRSIDKVDVIRVPSIRGQLRFWWRALYAHEHSPEKLYEMESALWGGPAGDDKPWGRSRVDLSVRVTEEGKEDGEDIRPGRTDGAYALFSAKSQRSTGIEAAPRRSPGTRFTLSVRCSNANDAPQVQRVLGAWILFGGIGGRTRRGLGALRPRNEAAQAAADFDALKSELDRAETSLTDTPSLLGAEVYLAPKDDPMKAWLHAVNWLEQFRQGAAGQKIKDSNAYARVKGASAYRPSISRWPEPDIVRRVDGGRYSHPPKYAGSVAYPRAQFGLPIEGRWQRKARDGSRFQEPPEFKLKLEAAERLASPLIVKPMWTSGGWKAIALWLNRALPNQRVGIKFSREHKLKGLASMDDWPDNALFKPLNGHSDMRSAFGAWLAQQPGVEKV